MIGKVAFAKGGRRILSPTVHGGDLQALTAFATAIQQEFTLATVPFCEISDRNNIENTPGLSDGFGLYSKVIITFVVDGQRFGYAIFDPRPEILTPVKVSGRSLRYKDRVTQTMLDRFAEIYPAENVTVETGWRCE